MPATKLKEPQCQAQVPAGTYRRPGRCEKRSGVKLVRWAPTPLQTLALLLCPHHRAVQERGGKVERHEDAPVVALGRMTPAELARSAR